MIHISGKQRRALRGLGHNLSPHVQVKQIAAGVLAEIDQQLEQHELIKVKFSIDDRVERRTAVEAIESRTNCDCVQEIGKTALFYRPNPEKKDPIKLPKS